MAVHAVHHGHGAGIPTPRHAWEAVVRRMRIVRPSVPSRERPRRRAPGLGAVTGNLGDAFVHWTGQHDL